MCLGGSPPPTDNSAEIAAQHETERQNRIKAGQANIDQAFAGFDDPYYAKVSSDYTDYYKPQLTQQYQKAMQTLTTQLADQGILNSSAGAKKLGDLRQAFGQNEASIANQALDQANNIRGQVNTQKSNLYATNNTAADPSAAAALAGASANSIAPPSYSPLGDIFSSLLKSTGQALGAEAAGYPGWQTGIFQSNTSGKGSGKLVG